MSTLVGTLPELQAAFAQLSNIAASHGLSISVADFGGERSQADTTQILNYRQADFNAAVNAGKIAPDTSLQAFRPINAFGTSFHNYGAAFDVQVNSRPSTMTDSQAKTFLGQFAPSIGLRWGGNFKNADPPHFELAIPIADAKARYAALGVQPLATDYSVSSDPFADASFDTSFDSLPTEDDMASGVNLPTSYDASLDTSTEDDLSDDGSSTYGGIPTSVIVGGLVVIGVVLFALRD